MSGASLHQDNVSIVKHALVSTILPSRSPSYRMEVT